MRRAPLLLFSCVALLHPAYALTDHYLCKVQHAYVLDASGRLVESDIYKQLIGQSFVVDRATGKRDGKFSWLKTSEFERTEVISSGKESASFKAISIGQPPASTVSYIRIVESDGILKRFYIADEPSLILSGTCE